MARASRCGSTVLEGFGLTAASMEAIIAVVKGKDLSWVEFAKGALWAPCLWRRLIYTVLSPPYDGPVNCAGGMKVAVKLSRFRWGCVLVGDLTKRVEQNTEVQGTWVVECNERMMKADMVRI